MADSSAAFTKMVPGFDFLEGLVRNAGAALPSVGQWIAPTLNPDELDKRIEELRTVQFWLEQNTRMLAATIQALEVQRMTLSTLRTMNLSVGELRDSMLLRMPETAAPRAGAAAPAPARKAASKTTAAAGGDASAAAPPAGVVDPMQWWGALTKQFTQLAATAMRDSAAGAAQGLADPMAWPPADAAGRASKQTAAPAAQSKTGHAQPAAGGTTAGRKSPAGKRRRIRP